MKNRSHFQKELKNELNIFLDNEAKKYPKDELLKIDFHCHDHNSNVPDELLGRILNVPETWLKTEELIETLKANKCDVFTVTNHNNAKSNFDLIKAGNDMLVGCEFSCMVPDYDIGIHVLAYGFTEDQEAVLLHLKDNIYEFLKYAKTNDIPTVWAHPLFQYKTEGIPSFNFFCKTALLFERFEVVNGQRNTWQNMLVKFWLESITAEDIDKWSVKFGINPYDYCSNPYKKSFTGGSDSHMGIFAGQTGTYLHIPDLKQRRKKEPLSQLALEAIKKGNTAVYGSDQNTEKLTVAFLDYFNQVCLNFEDPGLTRMLLHKGTAMDKLIAFLISNALSEIQRHKVTISFIELFHDSFKGKVPSYFKKLMVPGVYKKVFDSAVKIAEARQKHTADTVGHFHKHITLISNELNKVLFSRLIKKLDELDFDKKYESTSLDNIINFLELPSDLRSYSGSKSKKDKNMVIPDVPKFLDGLSFPMLTSLIILAANFTSAKSLTHLRPLYNEFSNKIGKLSHPKRALWLTDTFEDKNGVSMALNDIHKEIKKRKLPIDMLVCSNHVKPDDNLIVIKPEMEFVLPFYKQQPVRIPNFLKIHELFQENEYDRVICSTEGIMGGVALYLKHAFTVPANFYIHTDWITFAKDVLNFDVHELNRTRRYLRAYYGAFDNLFVLNSDQKKWLSGREMGFSEDKVFITAHWVDEIFKPVDLSKIDHHGKDNTEFFIHPEKTDAPTILYAGRISKEKGVMELPEIFYNVREKIRDVRIVIAGTGPAEAELKEKLPEAEYLGWVNHSDLPKIYSSADIFILPSKFDTFGCVVLEAMSCGLPVISYNTKGPKDIINDGKNGFLAETTEDIIDRAVFYLGNKSIWQNFSKSAIGKSKKFNADRILDDFMKANDL
jgi:glycosyltransferase involved in cell wall biosynthesis